jgi:hypothetical protein
MSSPCRCVEDTIARFIATAMKLWWEKTGLDPTVVARALWLETHPMVRELAKLPVGVADPPAVGYARARHGCPRDRVARWLGPKA